MDFDKLNKILKTGTKKELSLFVNKNNLKICDNKIYPNSDNDIQYQINFWDKRQKISKINLNSLYGALLNPFCRFFDERVGQSTTLCGRTITKHMASHINESIEGEYKFDGRSIIYGDTDSCFFTAFPSLQIEIENGELKWNKDFAIKLYDVIAEETNKSFPLFMSKAFNCTFELGSIIAASREMVAETGLFITKKRYATLMYELEGTRLDINNPGKVKAMGMDLKRSDTPIIIQNFLKEILENVLTGSEELEIMVKIKDFKIQFSTKDSWEKGTPKRVNKLGIYTAREYAEGKTNMPGHTRAAMNWNILCEMNNDKYSTRIYDGQKIIVCRLRSNPMGYTSIAYPIDEKKLPDWFKELPFDDKAMETIIIDKKIKNLLSVLKWDIEQGISNSTFNDLFEFS